MFLDSFMPVFLSEDINRELRLPGPPSEAEDTVSSPNHVGSEHGDVHASAGLASPADLAV